MAAAYLLAPAAEGQDAAPTSAGCELHLWPSEGLHSVYYGWFHGGINDGAVKGQTGYPKVDGTRLATDVQVRLFDLVRPQDALARPDYHVVIHRDAPGTRAIRTATGRLSNSTSTCYVELIVEEVYFQQDSFSGSRLKTLFRFRDFGSGATPSRVFGTWVETKLTHVPPASDAENELAGQELQAAYVANFPLFGAALNKPPKVKK